MELLAAPAVNPGDLSDPSFFRPEGVLFVSSLIDVEVALFIMPPSAPIVGSVPSVEETSAFKDIFMWTPPTPRKEEGALVVVTLNKLAVDGLALQLLITL